MRPFEIAISLGAKEANTSKWIFVKQGQRFLDTVLAIVRAVFSVFQVQLKGAPRYAIKFHQTPLRVAPEAFNPLDMGVTPG